jgi:hypothetical protein
MPTRCDGALRAQKNRPTQGGPAGWSRRCLIAQVLPRCAPGLRPAEAAAGGQSTA